MPRFASIVALVLHFTFTRLTAAQDTPPDTLTDSLTRRFQLDGDWLRRLPIDDPRHALVLIPGVRLTGADMGITPAAALMIRGSAAGRSNVYVDGASLRFETQGGAGIGLAPNAIEALSVLTGATPAYLADAGGGVIAYETPSGGERLAGGVRWDSDEPFRDGSSVGYNRIEGILSGPLAANGKLRFAVSTTLQGQQSSYRGPGAANIPTYLPSGVDTLVDVGGTPFPLPSLEQMSSGLRRPFDWATARRGHAKVVYGYGVGSSASLTLVGGDLQQRSFPGRFSLQPAAYTGSRLWSGSAIVNWRHRLRTWRGGPLTLDVNVSLVRHRNTAGPLDSTVELGTRDPSLGIAFRRLRFAGADILRLPTSDVLIRALRSGQASGAVPFFNVRPDLVQTHANPYGIIDGTWPTAGYGGTLTDVAERRVQGRWMIDWRRDRQQHLAVGIDLQRSHVSSYSSDIVRQLGTDAFIAKPTRFGLFTENRLVLADAVLDFGIRLDRINPGGDLPIVPGFVASSGMPRWNPSALTDDTAYANSIARVFRPARAKSVVSPRLRFAYPIGTGIEMRLGYSRTVEPPSWGTFFVHSNNDLTYTSASDLFGRDVDFGVAGLIEGGVRFARGPATLDVGVYRKDVPRYVARLNQFTDPRDPTKVITMPVVTLRENTHARGIDLGLDWRKGWVTASGAYGLAHIATAPEAGVVGQTPGKITTQTAAVAVSVQIPNAWGQGTLLGSVGRGTNLVLLARAQSGATYARQANIGAGTVTPDRDLSGPAINLSHQPWFKRLDLRIAKTVRTGGHDWSLYVDVRNLLNFSNLVSVFAETGDTANALHRFQTIGEPTGQSGQYYELRVRASSEGALEPDGTTVNLSGCATWSSQLNCVALNRVERRFGNGDQLFTLAEQQVAFESYYRDLFGAWRFYAPGRTIRVGMELAL